MADQGDGNQLLCQLGLANVRPWDYSRFTAFIFPRWVPHQWFGEACSTNGSGVPYLSSQSVLLNLARWLTSILGWGDGLDLRALGIVCSLALGTIVAFMIARLPGRAWFGVLIGTAITVIVACGEYADFFISPYPEPAMLLGTLAVLMSLLYLWRHDGTDWAGLAALLLSAIFTLSAAPQMASFLPVVIVAALWRPSRTKRRRRRAGGSSITQGRGTLRAGLLRRIPALVVCVILAASAGAYLERSPSALTEENNYDAVFAQILVASPDPQQDLAWFGLPQSLVNGRGTFYGSDESVAGNEAYRTFPNTVTEGKIALFYLAHPDRLVTLADEGLAAIAHPQLGYLGSYEAGTGHTPLQKESRVPIVTGVSVVFQAVPLLALMLQLMTLVLGAAVAARKHLGQRAVAFGRMTVFAMIALWCQFWWVMITDGSSERDRAMLVSSFLTSLCLPLLFALLLILRRNAQPRYFPPRARRGRRSAAERAHPRQDTEAVHPTDAELDQVLSASSEGRRDE
jgi:hypothetical protein